MRNRDSLIKRNFTLRKLLILRLIKKTSSIRKISNRFCLRPAFVKGSEEISQRRLRLTIF